MLQWYLTKYARLADGKVELLSYTPMDFNSAQYKATKTLSDNKFYFVECKVGSLLTPQPKPYWIARERYSHKPYVAKAQAEAEIKAQKLLDVLSVYSIDLDLESILSEMQLIKALLTKPQYDILLNCLMSKPQVMQILNKKGV